MHAAQDILHRLIHNIEQVILGKRTTIEQTVVALLCEGHVLIEDVPGVGKTMLARALACSLGCTFKRIQFTPDMLPSDVTGVSIFYQQTSEFRFREGPIFAHIVLADEINRASPKTQSSLLECMEERQVTVDGQTYPLPRPFLVLATQNPLEHEGVYPLPESQLDRFLLRLHVGYPERTWEKAMIQRQKYGHPIETIGAVVSQEELMQLQAFVRDVHVEDPVYDYLLEIVGRTRQDEQVYVGASPRGSLALAAAARAWATLRGRDYVLPDDVKAMAVPVLAHRMLIKPEARLGGLSAEQIVQDILHSVRVP
ncbi:MAG TPA: MoxR family ATPase [Armatimonadetes bacterium]|nr:MoxR family ATPase [Armatimonadota bacterium]